MLVAIVLAMGLHALVAPAFADELIVDDADPAVQLSGPWQMSATTPGFYGGGYLFHTPGHGVATARWPFPASGNSGQYHVYARWSSGANRATAAVYDVTSRNGISHVRVNQKTGGGQWHLLGTFGFEPGPGEGVTLTGEADGVVIADAIAWVGPLGSDPANDISDPAAAQIVQHAVDTGDQPWRLDPLEVARADTAAFGFSAADPMQLIDQEPGSAHVRAQHAGKTYEIHVIQPARLGSSGIWVVTSVQLAGSTATPQ